MDHNLTVAYSCCTILSKNRLQSCINILLDLVWTLNPTTEGDKRITSRFSWEQGDRKLNKSCKVLLELFKSPPKKTVLLELVHRFLDASTLSCLFWVFWLFICCCYEVEEWQFRNRQGWGTNPWPQCPKYFQSWSFDAIYVFDNASWYCS